MADVRSLVAVSSTPPDEAAENIKGAMDYDVTPDSYKEIAPDLKAVSEADRYPAEAPRAVADWAATSTEHASVAKLDFEKLNYVEKQLKYTSDTIKGKDLGREAAEYGYRRAIGEVLSEDEELQLIQSRQELKELEEGKEKYGFSFTESLAAEVVGGVYDYANAIFQGREHIAKGSLAGAMFGGGLGLAGGPAGTAAGAGLGALQGAVIGSGVAMIADSFKQSAGQIYNETTDIMGDSTKLAEDERRTLALGGGAIMGAISLLPVGTLIKQVPWLKKIVMPKSFVRHLLTQEGTPLKQAIVAVGKSGLAEGIEEGSQEAIQIVTSEMAKTWNGTETDFVDALKNSATKWENYKRVSGAAVIGTAVGGTITGGLRGAGTVVSKVAGQRPVVEGVINVEPQPVAASDLVGEYKNLPVINKGTRALQLKTALEHINAATKSTELKRLLPGELDQIRQEMFEDAGTPFVFIDKEDLAAWSDSEEKAVKAREAIDSSGVAASQINAPIRMEAFKLMRLMDDHPELASIVKSEPEAVSAKQWLNQVAQAEGKRKEIEAGLPQGETVQPIVDQRIRDQDIQNEDDYLSQPTFTEAMNKVLPAKEILKVNEAQLTTRVEVTEALKAEQDKHMDRVRSLEEQRLMQLEREEQDAIINQDQNVRIVEDFINNTRVFGELNQDQQSRVAKGEPAFAIDPDSLQGDLAYTAPGNEALKKRKVFVKGGMKIDDVVTIFGVKDADTLLDILSKTATRQEAVEAAVATQEARIKEEADYTTEFDESRLAKAYNNATRNHLKEMKILLERDWSAVKTGIKRIANRLPTLPELVTKAKDTVGSMRVKDLNVNQWKVGERRSQKRAVDAILNNELESAFREKENAAFNTQLAKETHAAIGKINRAFSWVANLSSKEVQAELKEAGKLYQEAVNYLLDVYNFDPNQKDQGRIESFNKFVAKMVAQGKGDFSIPPEVQEWISTRKSAKDLTVDQVLKMTNDLRAIVKQARLKNQLMGKYLEDGYQMTQEMLVEAAHENLINHPDYDTERSVDPQGDIGLKKISDWFAGFDGWMKNIQFIVKELDRGVDGGFWSQMIHQALEGIGAHEGPYGRSAKTKILATNKKNLQKAIKAYGKDFDKLGVTKVVVKEFRNIRELNNGNLTKLDLLRILMNMGNSENKNRVTNWNISIDTMWDVLKKNLEKRDFDFVQNYVWQSFKNLKPRIAALEKLTKGIDLEFVQPESFEAFGQVYEGGYFPIKYKADFALSSINEEFDRLDEITRQGQSSSVGTHPSFEGIVRSPHTKERTGADWVLNIENDTLSLGLEEVAHDLAFRVPTRDIITLLNDPAIMTDIKATIGTTKADTLLNSVVDVTKSAAIQNTKLYSRLQNQLANTLSGIESAFMINVLAGAPKSFFLNFLALNEAMGRMGVASGLKHLSLAALKTTANLKHFGKFLDFAGEIDPSIQEQREGVDEYSGVKELMPKKRLFANKKYDTLKSAQEGTNQFLMKRTVQDVDLYTKMLVTIAAYNQFMSGEAPGYSTDKIQSMLENERDVAAKGYANQVGASVTMRSDFTDKSPFQKIQLVRLFSRFFNEIRNKYNNRTQEIRNIRWNAEAMVEKVKDGDFVGANVAFQDSATRATRMAVVAMVGMAVVNGLRGQNPFQVGPEEKDDESDVKKIPEWIISKFTTFEGAKSLGVELFASNTPFLREMTYGAGFDKEASVPFLRSLTDLGMGTVNGLMALGDTLGLIEAEQELSDKQWRQVFSAVGLWTGGLPVNAYKYWSEIFEDDLTTPPSGPNLLDTTLGAINYFIQKFDKPETEDEELERIQDEMEGKSPKKNQLQDIVDELKEVRNKLDPPAADGLSDDDFELIKFTESKGKWNARPKFKDGGLRSSAFGLYQFTEETWRNVMNSPEGKAAGLTASGRLSRKPEQQEAAMRILTKQNARDLQSMGVPVNVETIYFAHHFGTKYAKEVYGPPDKSRISSNLLSPNTLKANPNLKGVKTAGEMKRHIRMLLDNGRDAYEQFTLR